MKLIALFLLAPIVLLAHISHTPGLSADLVYRQHQHDYDPFFSSLKNPMTATDSSKTAELEKLADKHLKHIMADSCAKEVIEQLAKAGEICKVLGHKWRDGRPGEGNGLMYADYHPYTKFRTCEICGESQSCDTRERWQ